MALRFHQQSRGMACHQCGYKGQVPHACEECGAAMWQTKGRHRMDRAGSLPAAAGFPGVPPGQRPSGRPGRTARWRAGRGGGHPTAALATRATRTGLGRHHPGRHLAEHLRLPRFRALPYAAVGAGRVAP
ncbi:hypothetical protein [Deinococcus radiophilus]|uniref:hypothetical protein n=1 Tax=Deinococcus radiophilus TaxID=32062 RepID=UPI0036235DB6